MESNDLASAPTVPPPRVRRDDAEPAYRYQTFSDRPKPRLVGEQPIDLGGDLLDAPRHSFSTWWL